MREQLRNLHLMIPFVRTGSQFRECKRLIDTSGLTRDGDLQLWVMAEVPSVVSWLDEYVRFGATGVSIGSNDLTQLVSGWTARARSWHPSTRSATRRCWT